MKTLVMIVLSTIVVVGFEVPAFSLQPLPTVRQESPVHEQLKAQREKRRKVYGPKPAKVKP